MPIDPRVLEAALARVNRGRRNDHLVKLEKHDPQRFQLSFPNRALPEGQCIDQDFTEIQWTLHEDDKLTTSIVGGRHDEVVDRYYIDYEVVEWD